MSRMLVALAAVLLMGTTGTRAQSSGTSPVLDGCVRAGPETKIVTFGAGRGDVLHAAILGRSPTGVVLSNQSDRDLCSWLPLAHTLERAGYRVLLYDYGNLEPWVEVASAARELHRLGVGRVVLVGASEGAKASIVAAVPTTTPTVGVVSLSAERYFRGGFDVKASAARLTRPILFVTAKNDLYAAGDTPILYKACRSPDKRLVTVAGSAHGVDLLSGASRQEVRGAILAFLRTQLGISGTTAERNQSA